MPAPIVVEAARDGGFVIRTHDPAPLPVAILFAGDAPDCLAYLAKWAGLQPPADQPTPISDDPHERFDLQAPFDAEKFQRDVMKLNPGEWTVSKPEVQDEVIRRAEEALDAAEPGIAVGEGGAGYIGSLERGFAAAAVKWRDVPLSEETEEVLNRPEPTGIDRTSAHYWRSRAKADLERKLFSQEGGVESPTPDLEDVLDIYRLEKRMVGLQVQSDRWVQVWTGGLPTAFSNHNISDGGVGFGAATAMNFYGSNALADAAKWLLEQRG